ncbi:MAG: glycosyltransferase [Sphingobacteriaceae bacterium]|nr:MAG: glycosyltransferase [Sphingobacteriaceae bacterium]
MNIFENVTLLITHYNRSKSLEHLLLVFAKYNLAFKETIVSDDGSKPEHLTKIKDLQQTYNFTLITTPANKGLGNNINKGQAAVRTPYTLYVQEDFEPTIDFEVNFQNALKLMQDEQQWDMVRFYTFPWAPFPYLQDYKYGYAQMLFKPGLWHFNHLKFRIYSDHPHLRRSTFFEKFGLYTEGKKGDPTEYEMCLSFIKNKGQALIFTGPDLFLHEHGAIEPNTMVRKQWKLSKIAFVKILRAFYLKIKIVDSTIKLKYMKIPFQK